MATEEKTRDAGSRLPRSPIAAAAVSLGIYVAMYLAVAGVVHILASPEPAAAAVAPYGSPAPVSAAAASDSSPSDQGTP